MSTEIKLDRLFEFDTTFIDKCFQDNQDYQEFLRKQKERKERFTLIKKTTLDDLISKGNENGEHLTDEQKIAAEKVIDSLIGYLMLGEDNDIKHGTKLLLTAFFSIDYGFKLDEGTTLTEQLDIIEKFNPKFKIDDYKDHLEHIRSTIVEVEKQRKFDEFFTKLVNYFSKDK